MKMGAGDKMEESSPTQSNEEFVFMRAGSSKTLGAMDHKVSQTQMHGLVHWLLHWPFILHTALVLSCIWFLSLLGFNYPLVYVLGFIFLFHLEYRHREKLLRRIRCQERKHAAQKQLLSDYESVRWLNELLLKAWPVFLEHFASQDFLAPLMPYFVEKFKPWTVQDAALQSFNLGRNPPYFAGIRAVDSSATDDDMVFEAAMEFVAGDDMNAVLQVQLKKRLGGIWSKVHLSRLHIEGKVRLGVRFLGGWPFVSRLRISFESAPYVQIEARPLTNYGVDVAELPGIASWLDTMLMDALEDCIVKPNMLVINVEKIANTWASSEYTSPPSAGTPPVAVAVVEIMEAGQLKPADVNGLADPFVKGSLNSSRFKTAIKWKTLNPKWMEVFRLPIRSWDIQNRLMLHVRDKDLFRDDNLGYCDIIISKFRDGNRHEICLPLKGVKTGRLTLAITVEELASPSAESQTEEEIPPAESTDIDESQADTLGSDHYEIIDTGVSASGVFSILRPGKAVKRKWHGRKGRKADDTGDLPDNTLFSGSGSLEREVEMSGSEDEKGDKPGRKRFWKWSHRGPKDKKPLSGELVTVSETGTHVQLRTVIDADPSNPYKAGSTAGISIPLKNEAGQVEATGNDDDAATTPPTLNVKTDPGTSSSREESRDTRDTRAEGGVMSIGASDTKPDESMGYSGPLDDTDVQEVSPGRRSVRDRARSVVKHAERTAAHIGHTLLRKKSGRDESLERR